jgi:cytosine/adenosine deaminase-related metal-dependent hydrolase
MPHTLIRNATIVSVDPAIGTLARGDILVTDDRIVEVSAAPLTAPEGAEVIEAEGMIAMPGFVNAHIHTWQTGLRGVAADWTIPHYLKAMHAGLATLFTPDDIRIANRMGALYQLDAGTTTMADWCHNNPTDDHSHAALDGLESTGVRAVFLHGSPKPDPKPGQPHFSEVPMPRDRVEALRKGRLSNEDGLITMGLAILGPQMSVQAVCDQDFRLARDLGLVASMHVSGPMLAKKGFQRLHEQGLLGPQFNVVHGNGLDDEDVDLIVEQGLTITPTIEIEMQMGFGNGLTSRVRARGGNAQLSIGSDVESGIAAEMFTVTRMTLQVARHEDNLAHRAVHGIAPPDVSIRTAEALEWATMGGARMLGLDHRIGSLTPGKQADIVLIGTRRLNMIPVHDPVASIVFHANAADVDTVMVAGKLRKRGGALVAPASDTDVAALVASGNRIVHAFRARMAAA